MNKKRLSVVMAGAMLATSVAPVLAAETTGTEIAFNQKEAFANQILNKLAEKKISNYAIFKIADNNFVSDAIQKELAKNDKTGEFSSKYGVKITGKDGNVKLDTTYRVDESDDLKTALESLAAGDKIEVYERETVDFKGQLLPGYVEIKASTPATKYVQSDLVNASNSATKAELKIDLSSIQFDKSNVENLLVKKEVAEDGADAKATLTVETQKLIDPLGKDEEANHKKVTVAVDSTKLDGRLPLDEKGNLLDLASKTDAQKFDKFEELRTWTVAEEKADKKGEKVIETYTIGEEPEDTTKETVKVSDLYDGIALTAKGTELAAEINNAKEDLKNYGDSSNEAELVRLFNPNNDYDATNAAKTGIYKFQIAYYKTATQSKKDKTANNVNNAIKVINVVSTDVDELKGLFNLLNSERGFKVGIVAGQNRYETAVNVAKQQNITAATFSKNIVLVNGMSLVDGLAAAPLASKNNAPLLLTEEGRLATSTKEYIESLIDGLSTAEKRKVTVNLVGGTAVLNSSLVDEIEDMGLTVKRIGGANREATSVAVAKELGTVANGVFVVGGNGEADAMSISAVAADTNTSNGTIEVAPIIVSKVGGLSTDALNFLRDKNVNDITIVGGEKVVSKEEEETINKALPGVKAMRIAGANRIETNNAIIKEFYSTNKAQGVVVVKDGIASKNELVDALSAANYAASLKAPIVLASTTVTDAQKSTLLNVKHGSTFNKLVQVGMGAERTVLESLAKLLNIKNN